MTAFVCTRCYVEHPGSCRSTCTHDALCNECWDYTGCAECRADGREDGRL